MGTQAGLFEGNLAAHLELLAHKNNWSERDAYFVGDDHYTYADVFAGMHVVADGLAASGVRAGDQVAVALSDGVEFVWTYLAVLWLGGIAILINPRLPPDELAALVQGCTSRIVVCDDTLEYQFTGVKVLTYDRIASGAAASVPVPARLGVLAPAYGQFTSGTTGTSRVCIHRHADPLIYQQAFGRPVLGLRPGDVTLSISKAYFAYGLGNSLFYPLLSGAAAVLIPGAPDVDVVLDEVVRRQVRVLYAVPSFYARLLKSVDVDALRSVELAICAGEVLPRAVEADFAALEGPLLLNGIGTTEVGQAFASNTAESLRPGTVGRPLPPYEVRVVDEEGNEAPVGAEGHLVVRGVTVARPLNEDDPPMSERDWYATGDLASRDAEGYIAVLGRYDDTEIVGGINMKPAEVEGHIAADPRITDSAVCAVTDAAGVSRLVAYVVLSDACTDQAALAADLFSTLRRHLAPYKVPRDLISIDRLPRTHTGKLQRRVLRDLAARHERTGRWYESEFGNGRR